MDIWTGTYDGKSYVSWNTPYEFSRPDFIFIRYHLYPHLDKDIKTCEDIDECTAKRPCDVNGLCMNTQEWLSCDHHPSVDQNKYGRY